MQNINSILAPKTHQLGRFEGGDKPVLIVLLSWEISIKQQQKIQKAQNTEQSTKDWLK